MIRMILGLAVAVLAPLAAAATPSAGGDAATNAVVYALDEIRLPVNRRVEDVDLVLHGAGFLRAGFFFRAYGAALYLQDHADAGRILADVPKRLEIHYLHHTPRRRMVDTANETLARNVAPGVLASLQPAVLQLHAEYGDRRPGDIAALTYIPGRGTEFSVNGERRTLIPGSAFAAAYFTVWLGDKPSSETVKEQLLTQCRPAAGEKGDTR